MAKGAYIGVNGVARKIKKGYIGVENFVPRNLPSGYTQVEYIESSGAQYIDTGFKPSNNSRVVMDIQASGFNNRWLFGSRTSSTSASFAVGLMSTSTVHSEYGSANTTATVSKATERTTVDKNKNVCLFGSVAVTNTAATFSGTYPIYLLSLNNGGTAASKGFVGKLYSCQIYNNGTLVRDYVPCKNSAGTAGLYDLANGSFYTNAGSGTFAVGSAHNSVARKIKKAYIGIGGVARPCFGGGELEYYGAITPFGTARESHAATSNGKYALFAGGSPSNATSVEVYDASLVHSTAPTGLSVGRYWLAATSVGEYAIFGGGYYNKTNVDAYNSSLTHTSCTAFTKGVCELAATTVGNYALFGGGRYVATEDTSYSYVYSYNGSLTKGSPTALSKARSELAATTVGDYAIFAGGYVGYGNTAGNYSTVDTYSASLTKSTASSLSTATRDVEATTVGDYALFAGGASGSTTATSKVVNAYNRSLTRSTPTALSVARYQLAATTVGNYAIFGGGSKTFQSSLGNSKDVDVYDESLVRTVGTSLSKARGSLAATTIGNYALFGGGSKASAYSATVDVYTVQ